MPRSTQLSVLKQALLAIENLQDRLDRAERLRNSLIAIVGMACRFPGADSPLEFWRLLESGTEAISEIPAGRLGGHTRRGGFLRNVDGFDASFFRISPREAARMDPQQRLFLELTWEALEDAGIPPGSLNGSQTAVYAGVHSTDYAHVAATRPDRVDAHYSPGVDSSYIAGRVSYFLGLHGPAMAVDTACSSSLTGVHLACQSLRDGESSLAIAGGVKLILSPHIGTFLDKAGALSKSGRCRAFDAAADGMVQGEGCGVVVLRRLPDALAEGDRILAVIRGSAVNHDGPSIGLTAPNSKAQEMLMREALRRARIDPADVDYLETHGTGTPVGDPVELHGIAGAYCKNRRHPLWIGSVKTNIGHLESAAGIAGLIKTVLILQNRKIPPSLHFETPTPAFSWSEWPLAVASRTEALRADVERPVTAVSSFGMSGVNAHVVVEAAPDQGAESQTIGTGPFVLPLSAQSRTALECLAERYEAWLDTPDAPPLGDICHTAGVRRNHHAHRLAVIGDTAAEIRAELAAYRAGRATRNCTGDVAVSGIAAQPVFVFSGQGPQWWAMGRQLMEEEAIFRRHAEACDSIFRELAGWSILREMMAPEEATRVHDTEVAQPALFVLQTALAAFWRSRGVTPGAVVGHSAGEAAAAYIAGVYSLEDAIRLVYHRGRIMQRATGLGKMAAVSVSGEDAHKAIVGYEDRLSLAAVNGPRDCVLSGDADALTEILARWNGSLVTEVLRGNYAFHSPQMDALQEEFEAAISGIRVSASTVPLYSTVTGRLCAGGEEFHGSYWRDNIRRTVLFHSAMKALLVDGYRVFLEISPHPVLVPAMEACIEQHGSNALALASLHRKRQDRPAMHQTLARLYCRGSAMPFRDLYPAGKLVTLPAYPWQRERFWLDEERPLLGRAVRPANQPGVFIWETKLTVEEMPYLGDHRIRGQITVPGVTYLEMALAAAAQVFPERQCTLENVLFRELLTLPEGGAQILQLVVTRESPAEADVQFLTPDSEEKEAWKLHATGRIQVSDAEAVPHLHRGLLSARGDQAESGDAFYGRTAVQGMHYGPAFRGIEQIWRRQGEVVARLRVPEGGEGGRLSPGLFDSALHASLALVDGTFLPAGFSSLRFYHTPNPELTLWSRAVLQPSQDSDSDSLNADVTLADEEGRILLAVDGLMLRRAPSAADELLYQVRWEPRSLPPAHSDKQPHTWLLLADAEGVGAGLRTLLEKRGSRCVVARPAVRFAQTGPADYEIDPASAEDYVRLLASLRPRKEEVGIVHLWSLDVTQESLSGFDAAYDLASGAVLHLIQALSKAGWTRMPHLWMVTREAQAAAPGTGVPCVAQAPLWGLGRVIGYEHPELRSVLVDLDAGGVADSARVLLIELTAGDTDDEVAWRHATRYVPRLVRTRRGKPGTQTLLRPDSTYLITGGLGGIGLGLAEWLVKNGARSLALAGRSGPSAEAQHRLAAMSQSGARLAVFAVDVSQPGDVEKMLRDLESSRPPIRGVFHAAGVLDDGTLLEQNRERLRRVARPKIDGAWNLHWLTRHLDLDHFVLFSSTASLIGSPGQGNYAAANAFLDALAVRRNGSGQAGLSINWGAWSEIGMAAAESYRGDRLASRGMRPISPEEAFQALASLLQSKEPHCAVARFDAHQWVRHYPQRSRNTLLRGLMESRSLTQPKSRALAPASRLELRSELLSAGSAAERLRLLERFIQDQVSQVTGLPSGRVDRHAPFLTMGIDSLQAIELRTRVLAELEITLPVQHFLRDASVARLSNDLLVRLELESVIQEDAIPQPITEEDVERISI